MYFLAGPDAHTKKRELSGPHSGSCSLVPALSSLACQATEAFKGLKAHMNIRTPILDIMLMRSVSSWRDHVYHNSGQPTRKALSSDARCSMHSSTWPGKSANVLDLSDHMVGQVFNCSLKSAPR